MSPLEHPLWTALTGPQRAFGRRVGRAAGLLPEVGMFVALAPDPVRGTWDDLAEYAGPGGTVLVAGLPHPPPAGWSVDLTVPCQQMTAPAVPGCVEPAAPGLVEPAARGFAEPAAPGLVEPAARRCVEPAAPGFVELSAADVPEMLDLARRTRPGPFAPRTIELGRYLGVRRSGRLAAMAGERMRPPGHTEISSVCTDPGFRGQGLAALLVTALATAVRARGETPFLHVAEFNTGAIRVYERLGFQPSRTVVFAALTAPR